MTSPCIATAPLLNTLRRVSFGDVGVLQAVSAAVRAMTPATEHALWHNRNIHIARRPFSFLRHSLTIDDRPRIASSGPTTSRPTGISRTTLRGSQHYAKPACSKNVHNFVRRQGLIEEAGSCKTLH